MVRPKKRDEVSGERKRWAIEQVDSQGRSVRDVAKEMGVSRNTLYRWIRTLRARRAPKESGAKRTRDGSSQTLVVVVALSHQGGTKQRSLGKTLKNAVRDIFA
ncbi:MAG: transposase [Pseudomonadota bacterium]